MKKFSIILDDVEKIKTFCEITNRFEVDIDVKVGRYNIDAKSVLGLLSLDLQGPVDCKVHSEEDGDADGLIAALQEKSFQISAIS